VNILSRSDSEKVFHEAHRVPPMEMSKGFLRMFIFLKTLPDVAR